MSTRAGSYSSRRRSTKCAWIISPRATCLHAAIAFGFRYRPRFFRTSPATCTPENSRPCRGGCRRRPFASTTTLVICRRFPCTSSIADSAAAELLLLFHARGQQARVGLSRAFDLDGVANFERCARRVLELRRAVRLHRGRADLERQRVRGARSGHAAGGDRSLQLGLMLFV